MNVICTSGALSSSSECSFRGALSENFREFLVVDEGPLNARHNRKGRQGGGAHCLADFSAVIDMGGLQ